MLLYNQRYWIMHIKHLHKKKFKHSSDKVYILRLLWCLVRINMNQMKWMNYLLKLLIREFTSYSFYCSALSGISKVAWIYGWWTIVSLTIHTKNATNPETILSIWNRIFTVDTTGLLLSLHITCSSHALVLDP